MLLSVRCLRHVAAESTRYGRPATLSFTALLVLPLPEPRDQRNLFPRSLSPTAFFVIALALLAIFKLWLVHTEETYGHAAEYDSLWHLNAARHWYWGSSYNWTAFVRPPAYPLWIAVVHLFGLPLRIATELLQLGGYAVLIVALRKAGLPRSVGVLGYAALILHPGSFQLNNYTMADSFYAGVFALALGGFGLTLLTNRTAHALWTGLAVAVLWHAREETVLLGVLLATYVLLAWCRDYSPARNFRKSLRHQARATVAMCGLIALIVLTVSSVNQRVFHSFAASDMASPAFNAAYKALLRIKPEHPLRFIPISRETRQLAYSVSPAFARLQPALEGELGRNWEIETLSSLGIPNEIAAGWFRWTLRNAAASIGVHGSGQRAAAFYRRVAREINQACDERRVPTRLVLSGMLDPNWPASMPYLPASFGRIAQMFVLRYALDLNREDEVLRRPQRALYDEMANRRAALTRVGRLTIAGWAFRSDEPISSVAFRNEADETEAETRNILPRPDVAEQLAQTALRVPEKSGFLFEMDVFRVAEPKGKIAFTTASGAVFAADLADLVQGSDGTISSAAGGPPLTYHIDQRYVASSATTLSQRVETWIGTYHRVFVISLLFAAIGAAGTLLLWHRRLRGAGPLLRIATLLFVAISSRIGFLTILDATSWPANQERYLIAVTPLLSVLLIVLIYGAIRAISSPVIAPAAPKTSPV